MNTDNGSLSRPLIRNVSSTILILLAIIVAAYAFTHYRTERRFQNPIAYIVVGDTLYVAEKEKNTILALQYASSENQLSIKDRFQIEQDDADYYYMVRRFYPGPNGVVVRSWIYEQKTKDFVGYRFREYRSFAEPPKEIFTIYLKDPKSYPDINYAFDKEGNHYFVNNCAGQNNIWKIPAGKIFTMSKGNVSSGIQQLGEKNGALSSWASITIGSDGQIYVTSIAAEKIVEYSPYGLNVRVIGSVGFEKGQLLAPYDVFFTRMAQGEPSYLTVTSAGNRTWVQFDAMGKVVKTVSPLEGGYPFSDIYVGRVYEFEGTHQVCSFDLVNRSLLVHTRNFSAITTYRTSQPEKTFLLFGIGVVLLLPVIFFSKLTSILKNLRFPFFFKLLLLSVPLIVICTLVVGSQVKDLMKADLDAESIRRSANLARAIINSIALADLEKVQNPEDRGSAAYERIYETVSRIVDLKEVEYTPKWIIHKIRNNRYYFGINIWRGSIYEPFIVPRDRRMFFNVLSEMSPQFGRFRDEMGEWFSYLYPIQNASSRVIYVLELYRPTEEMDRSEKEAENRIRKIGGSTVLIAILLVFLFSYRSTRPLRKLIEGTHVVSKGEFDHVINVHSRDEMGTLAQAFNNMVADLKKYTHDLAKATAARERIESELKIAHDIQMGILPKIFPPFPDRKEFEIYATLEPAKEVGGDLYDFFFMDDDHLCFTIGDVSGKGVPAAIFMAVCKTLIKMKASAKLTADKVIGRVNQDLSVENPSLQFVTLFLGVLNVRTGVLDYSNGGHNPPYLIRNNGDIEPLETTHGMALGVMEDFIYQSKKIVLQKGETLFLYTDGVTEAIDQKEELFSDERLKRELALLKDKDIEGISAGIIERIKTFSHGMPQADDITMLVLRYKG
ncbi:MAG: SpoIIE family protein phosphatase [Pseudomonadota bacterium]